MIELNNDGVPASEYSKSFLQGMLSRMGVSFYKYGAVSKGYPKNLDAIASLKQRLEHYEKDGNAEWLIDVANFAMIEFMHPAHPRAHFAPQDSDTSPGRIGQNGRMAWSENDHPGWSAPGPKDWKKEGSE